MPRHFAQIKYHGKPFHGWQRQINAGSVQQTIEERLTQMFRKETPITGCGRTDTGVHASQFFFHFDTEEDLPSGFAYKLNTFLPHSIAIIDIQEVSEECHARFDATERSYRYFLHQTPDPFIEDTSFRHHNELDFEKMNEAALHLIEARDFASFQRSHTNSKTTICDVRQAEWLQVEDDRYCFTITADRFLRNMVRAIVGTLVDVGKGRVSPSDFKQIIDSTDRKMAGASAPAHGLFLTKVSYPFL